MKKRLLFVVNTTDFFLSHRLPIALAAQREGYEVHIATGTKEGTELLASQGLAHHSVRLTRSGKNLLWEMHSIWQLARLMRRLKPDIVHLVTIKPVLYGGIAARLVRVPAVVAAISGLGSVFITHGVMAKLLRRLVKQLYRLALSQSNLRVIFQNKDDQTLLSHACDLQQEQTVLIPGSGVDLAEYPFKPEPEGVPVVTYAARLLKDKGACEFVEAARIIGQRGIKARFLMAGTADPDNPGTITQRTLMDWSKETIVELLGYQQDIAGLFARSNIICLPSYYGEGLPKVLIEAASCGRAVVTTDHPGCRDAIIAGETGLLVPIRNATALADALEKLITEPDMRISMGTAGRGMAEREFSIKAVVAVHLETYRQLVSDRSDS